MNSIIGIVSHGYGISAIWKEDLEILEKSLNDGWEIVNATSQSVSGNFSIYAPIIYILSKNK